jgi:hypothetical protein
MGRPDWAWEFLRRNREYRLEMEARSPGRRQRLGTTHVDLIEAPDCLPGQLKWGLSYIEDAAKTFPVASVFWQPEADPGVLAASARSTANARHREDSFDVTSLPGDISILKLSSGAEHVLIRQGAHALQLSIIDGTVLDGPVVLEFQIAGFEKTVLKILALRRLIALRDLGRFPTSLFAADARVKRWLLELRALDMLQAGYSRQEMARIIFGESFSASRSDWAMSRLRRLLTAARHISEVGYFGILAGASTRMDKSPLQSAHDRKADVLPFPPVRQ